MPTMVPKIIINPVAGRGRGAASREEIEGVFRQAGQPVEIVVTTQPGDATQWAYEAAEEGVPFIAGAGGDGTANEIMNGLARWAQNSGHPQRIPRFGMIPVGTGNDFGYNFQLPTDVPGACQKLMNGNLRWMDVGLVESDTEPPLYFVNGVGLGFDAIVNIESRKITALRGAAVYVPAALKTLLFYYRAPHTKVVFDEETLEDDLMMISVMNGERFGAVFHMTPGSRIDDGYFSLCFVRKLPRQAMLPMLPRFIRGTHPKHPRVVMAKARRLTVESSEPLPSHVDGEIYSVRAQRYAFTIMPWKVPMLC